MLPSNHFSIDVTGAYNVHNTTQLYNQGSSLPNLQDMHYFQFKLQDNTKKGETWLPLFHPTLTYDLHCWLEFIVSASTSWVLRQHSRRELDDFGRPHNHEIPKLVNVSVHRCSLFSSSQLNTKNTFQLYNNLVIWYSFPRFILLNDLWLFIDELQQDNESH